MSKREQKRRWQADWIEKEKEKLPKKLEDVATSTAKTVEEYIQRRQRDGADDQTILTEIMADLDAYSSKLFGSFPEDRFQALMYVEEYEREFLAGMSLERYLEGTPPEDYKKLMDSLGHLPDSPATWKAFHLGADWASKRYVGIVRRLNEENIELRGSLEKKRQTPLRAKPGKRHLKNIPLYDLKQKMKRKEFQRNGKPNWTALGRVYNVDPDTVKKRFEQSE